MTREEKQALIRQVGRWAQKNGRPRPKDEQGWKVLIAEFFAQRNATVQKLRAAQLMAAQMQAQMQAEMQHQREDEEEESSRDGFAGNFTTDVVNDGVTSQFEDRVQPRIFKDDWQQLLEDRARAAVGPNGELLEDFDREWQLQEKHKKELAKEAPFVSTSPITAVDAMLGNQVVLTPNVDTTKDGDLQGVVRWSGHSIDTRPVVITAGLTTLPVVSASKTSPPVAAGVLRPTMRINWGTLGGQFSADVDVGNGAMVCLGASFVNVDLYLAAGSTVQVSAFAGLAFDTSDKVLPSLKTSYLDDVFNVGAGTAVWVSRPTFATTLEAFLPTSSGNTYRIQFEDWNASLIAVFDTTVDTVITSIKLPNDCAALRVINNGPSNTGHVRVVWGLSLG